MTDTNQLEDPEQKRRRLAREASNEGLQLHRRQAAEGTDIQKLHAGEPAEVAETDDSDES